MKLKFETLFRVYVVALLAILLWSLWNASAQNSAKQTNRSAAAAASTLAASTNAPAGETGQSGGMETPQWIERLATGLPFLKIQWFGNELWKYLFSLIYIFLAFYVSKFADYLTRVWLKKWAGRTETKFDDLLLELLNGPVKVVLFVIFLRIGLDVFQWPDLVQKLLAKGFTVIVACSLTYMGLKFIDLLMGYWKHRATAEADRTFDEQLFPIVRKTLKLFVIVVAALVTLTNIGIDVTAAIASLSIGGLAVGLAAQDTLANLFVAVAVFVDK